MSTTKTRPPATSSPTTDAPCAEAGQIPPRHHSQALPDLGPVAEAGDSPAPYPSPPAASPIRWWELQKLTTKEVAALVHAVTSELQARGNDIAGVDARRQRLFYLAMCRLIEAHAYLAGVRRHERETSAAPSVVPATPSTLQHRAAGPTSRTPSASTPAGTTAPGGAAEPSLTVPFSTPEELAGASPESPSELKPSGQRGPKADEVAGEAGRAEQGRGEQAQQSDLPGLVLLRGGGR